MNLNSAFKLFDIRGHYPEVVDERLAFLVGKSLGLWKKPRKVILAIDARISSPKLKEFLIDGFTSCSIPTEDLGLCSVPRFYFSVATTNADLGIMITASHSSLEENGFKIVGTNGLPFSEQEIEELHTLIAKNQADQVVVEKGTTTKIDTLENYVKAICRLTAGLSFPNKICIDYNDSSAKEAIKRVFLAKNLAPIEVDNPTPGNPLEHSVRTALSSAVQKNNAACGVIWDSDGDRVVFVDSRGEIISLSFVLGMLARETVATSRAKKIAVDVRAGLIVRDLVASVGGSLEILPAWHQFIQFAMVDDKNIGFGGETSGHFMYADFDMIDDGLLAGLRFLDLIARPGFEAELNRLKKKYFELPEMNFPCSKEKAALVLNRLADYYRSKNYSVSIKDGVTVFGFDWKINLRQSATEPLLRLNLEAKDASRAQQILGELDDHLALT